MIDSSTAALPRLPTLAAAEVPAEGFDHLMIGAVGRVDGLESAGDDALRALASGGDVDLHGAMIALEEADIALRAMVTVRDKVVSAYEQILNLAI